MTLTSANRQLGELAVLLNPRDDDPWEAFRCERSELEASEAADAE